MIASSVLSTAITSVLRPGKSNVALLEGAACPPTKGLAASRVVFSVSLCTSLAGDLE